MDGAGTPAPAARAKMFSACRCLPYRSNPCASPHTAGGMPMIVRKGAKPAVRFRRQIRGVRRAGSNHGQGTGTESRLWSERNKNKVAGTVKSGTCGWAVGPEQKRKEVGRNDQSKGRAVGPQAQSEKASGWAERPEQRESGWAERPEQKRNVPEPGKGTAMFPCLLRSCGTTAHAVGRNAQSKKGERLGGTTRAARKRMTACCGTVFPRYALRCLFPLVHAPFDGCAADRPLGTPLRSFGTTAW